MNVRRPLFAIAVVMLVTGSVAAQSPTTSDEPLSERRVSYTMDVRLDVEERLVAGQQRIVWRNPAAEPVDELQFHMYLNAFSGPESTFMKESGGQHRGFTADGRDPWGGVYINHIERVTQPSDPAAESRIDLRPSMRFIQPDDGNPEDRTVMQIDLDRPVAPGDSIVLDVDFTSRLPEIVARTLS